MCDGCRALNRHYTHSFLISAHNFYKHPEPKTEDASKKLRVRSKTEDPVYTQDGAQGFDRGSFHELSPKESVFPRAKSYNIFPHLYLLVLLCQSQFIVEDGAYLPVLGVVGDGQLFQRLHYFVDLFLAAEQLVLYHRDLGEEGEERE